jgi:hypothetical protein
MPEHIFDFNHPETLVFDPPTVAGGPRRMVDMDGKGVMLRRLDPTESNFSVNGKYYQSFVTLPNFSANGMTDLYGFEIVAETSGDNGSTSYGGTVDFRLSNDGGITWMVYDTDPLVLDWVVVPAVGTLSTYWMLPYDVDLNIDTFPIVKEDQQVMFRMRLTPTTDGLSTPFVKSVILYVGLEYDFQDDVLRSTKHHLEQLFRMQTTWVVTVNSQDRIKVEHYWETLYTPCTAYNLTADPGRTTNLFKSIDGKDVLLTSLQTGQIEVKVYVSPSVFIAAEEFFQTTTSPAIIINLNSCKEIRNLRNGNGELDYATARGKAREGFGRIFFDAELRASLQSSLQHEAVMMSESFNRAITQGQVIMSDACGEPMAMPMATPTALSNRISQGLFVRDFAFTVFGKAWLRNDLMVERHLITEIDYQIHPVAQTRGVYAVQPF